MHYTNGAKKYDAHNWRKGMPFSRTLDSVLRHVFAYLIGNREEDHLSAAVFGLLCLIEWEEEGRTSELDDLYKSPSSRTLDYIPDKCFPAGLTQQLGQAIEALTTSCSFCNATYSYTLDSSTGSLRCLKCGSTVTLPGWEAADNG